MEKHKSHKKDTGKSSVLNKTMRKNLKLWFPLFLLPTVAAFLIGFVWPFIWGIFLSFFKFKTIKHIQFNGLNNYIKAFQDPAFGKAFMLTAIFAIISIVVINVLAFALAYALTSGLKGSTFFRSIFFMPNLIGGIVLGYLWKVILDEFVRLIWGHGLLDNSNIALVCLIVIVAWQQIGYMMIIYIAGLQNIPQDYIEAAKVDGASSWTILRKIIIPFVMPSITICLFLTLTNSFKLFDQNFALTGGAPFIYEGSTLVGKTSLVALNIYKSFYETTGINRNLGIGQAKAVIFFIFVVGISLIQLYFTKRKEVQR